MRLVLSWGNIAPGPFKAEDYEFRRAPPSPTNQDLGAITHPIGVTPLTGAPTTIPAAAPASNVLVNPYLAPPAATQETLTNASPFHQQPVPAALVEAETLGLGRRLAERRSVQPDTRLENAQVVRSKHPHAGVPASTPVVQRYNTEVAPHQPARKQRVLGTKVHAEIDRQRTEKKSKWWEIGGDLRNNKRHFRREAIDYGNPNADYCSANQLGDHGNSLKRGRANRRRQRPQKDSSPKAIHGSKKEDENQDIFSQGNGDQAHPSTATNPSKHSGQKPHPKSTGATSSAESNHQLDWRFPRDYANHRPVSAARQPLASLDPNLVANEGADSLPDAEAVQHSDDCDSFSHKNGVQAPTPAASLWFGEGMFFEDQDSGPSQL
ncbi:hypothetical protein FRC00_011458 [Tulasnella sp. 408]|nr:hypothetical protein FRC00_011458 [Tulasnella sp. 408]